MSAGSIIIDLLMRTGSFETDTKRAEKRLKDFEKGVKQTATSIATGVGAIAAAIGGSIAVVDQFAQSIAVYQDIADKIGDTASAVSSLQMAADLSGTALDTIGAASVRLTASLSKVDDESDAVAKALAAINIPLNEFKALSPVEQLDRVARSLAQFEDGAAKTAIAVQLFGKAGADLIPFLNDLAEQQERNATLTDEQIEAADTFTKTLAKLRSEFSTVAKSVAADIIPSFQAFIDYTKESEVVTVALQAAGAVLRTVFETVAVVAANVAFVLVGVGREIGAIAAQIAALARLDITGFRAISQAVKEDAARARAELEAFEKRILGLSTAPTAPQQPQRPAINFNPNPVRQTSVPAMRVPAVPKVSEADRYLESLQRQLERTKELTVTEQLLTDIQAGRLGKVTAAQQAALVGIAEQIDAVKRQQVAEDERPKALEKQRQEFEAIQQQGQAIYEATRTPLEKLNAEQARLNDLLAQGAIDWDTYSRAVFAAQDAYDNTTAAASKTTETVDSFSKRFAENAQDQLGQGLFDLMSGNFKNIGDGFVQMVNRMVAEAIAADIAKALFGDLLEGGKGEGIFGSILKNFKDVFGGANAGGGTFGTGGGGLLQTLGSAAFSFFGGSFAGGGDVFGGRPVLVGEQGPEMFVPRTAGTIMTAAQTTAMGKNVTVNAPVTVAVSGAVDRRTREQIAADVQRAVGVAVARGTA